MLRNKRTLLLVIPLVLAGLMVGAVTLFLNTNRSATAAPLAQATATFRATRTPLTTSTATADAEEEDADVEDEDVEATDEEEEETLQATPTAAVTATEVVTDADEITATATPTAAPLAPVFTFTETVDVETERTLTVRGVGQASAEPDQARVRVGVVVVSPTLEAAVEQANQQIEDVIEALQEAGIDEQDIQTTQFNIFREEPGPLPEDQAEDEQQVQYRVIQEVSVMIEDLDEVGDILGAAVEAGANQVSELQFTLAEPAEVQRSARAAAVEDAYQRAQDLATLAGVDLTGVVQINEGGTDGGPRPVAEDAALGLGGAVPVQPGQLNVTSQVEVTFAIE